MTLRRRFQTFMIALCFYGAAGGIVSYFWWHAHHGERGLHAKAGFKVQIAQLNQDIAAARKEKTDWERRVALLRAESLDRDLLEERARILLNSAHRNDLIVLLPPDVR
ncbi:MAG: FtsB family cell division protein [Beijerinckiaceae bacterium]